MNKLACMTIAVLFWATMVTVARGGETHNAAARGDLEAVTSLVAKDPAPTTLPRNASEAAGRRGSSMPDSRPAGQALLKAVDDLRQLKTPSYHVFLREAYLRVPPLLKGQRWSDLEPLFGKAGWPLVEKWENGDVINTRYLLKKDAFHLAQGQSLDMQLFLSIAQAKPTSLRAQPGSVVVACVVLAREDINVPYEQFMEHESYPKGTVLDVVLRKPETEEKGRTWPLLKAIRVHYGLLDYISAEAWASGFHTEVEFSASATESVGGESLLCYIESGLDPLRTGSGKVLSEHFVSRDTLGDVWCGAGNSWWQGNPGTIEANKRKYLRGQP